MEGDLNEDLEAATRKNKAAFKKQKKKNAMFGIGSVVLVFVVGLTVVLIPNKTIRDLLIKSMPSLVSYE